MRLEKHRGTVPGISRAPASFRVIARSRFTRSIQRFFHLCLSVLIPALALPFQGSAAGPAQDNAPPIRVVRVIEAEDLGYDQPAGLAFSSRANAFLFMEGAERGQPQTTLRRMSQFAEPAGSARIAAAAEDPRNLAYDARLGRLLFFQPREQHLIEVREGPDGDLDPRTLVRHPARHLRLVDPQGLTVDPASGALYFLDAAGPRLVRVTPQPDGSVNGAAVSAVDLPLAGLRDLRGLAFDPATGRLHLLAGLNLYAFSPDGQMVATWDLAALGLQAAEGMVFAPSGDQTDDPATTSLFIIDPGDPAATDPGGIVELSFDNLVTPQSDFTSTLVRTTNLAAISPPSPDPSGITYLPDSHTLLMVDGEVDETVNGITHFQGVNAWELTLSGQVVRTANLSRIEPTFTNMSNEPTGIARNPVNGHYYVSDDGRRRVFDLDPGDDGLIGTADDQWTYFDTVQFGSGDPEGITVDTWRNRLFVVDGVNREVYQYTLSGALISHFDVLVYGVLDPESIVFNPFRGTLFVMSSEKSSPLIVETTTSGELIQTIDISAAAPRTAAGLALAPASSGSGSWRFYIVDRGIDNDNDPNIIDGKMYEMTAPVSSSGNTPPVVNAGPNQTVSLPQSAVLNGSIVDDDRPVPLNMVIATWSKVSGPGKVTFSNPNALSTRVSFAAAGTYVLRLTANDSAQSASDEVTIKVNPMRIYMPLIGVGFR